jgi:hypothetical protein
MVEHHGSQHFTPEEATRDLVGRLGRGGSGFRIAVVVLAVLAAAGVFGLASLVAGGPEPRAKWGYPAAVLAFLLSTAHAAPILALMTRLAKGFWGIPLRRVAELFAVAGLVTTPVFILLLFQLPDWRGRPSIWFDWPGGPHVWDSLAIILFSLLGLALLYLSSLPDLAAAGDARMAARHGARPLGARLALGWTGSVRQWQVLSGGVVVLGAFYLMLYAFVHLLLVSDLAISLVPGWHSSIIPPYHGISGLQAGVAATLLMLAGLRRFRGLRRYIGLDPFWGGAKLMLALSLLFFYFTWIELLTLWYGRTPDEQQVLGLMMFGPYLWLFVVSFGLNFVLTFVLLIWNPIRVSIKGPTCVAALVLIGNFVDRIRIYVAAWSVAGPAGEHLEHLPPTQYPGLVDVLVLLGMPAAVGLLYLLALRLVPPISLWEYKTGLLLKVERPYLKTAVTVVAKPR